MHTIGVCIFKSVCKISFECSLLIDSGVERPQLGASAPVKNGKDLTFKGVNGLALIVWKLNLRMLLIHFEPQIRQLQNWGSDNQTSHEESTQNECAR